MQIEDIFNVIHEAHVSIGHGGRNRMVKETGTKYKNITAECIMIYLNLCIPRLKKSKVPKKGLVVKPMVFSEMNSRAQVDLIDMQSQADGENRWIFVYQNHLTKFVQLRPVTSKRAPEIAYQLLGVFSIFGAPNILQSDNGREFVNSIIEELRSMWKGLKIVHGKPRHSKSQGSVERANRDIEDMLTTWLHSNSRTHWADGLRFIQVMKNRSYHEGLKYSPYEAMFRQPMKVGLKTSNVPNETINEIQTEEELEKIISSMHDVDAAPDLHPNLQSIEDSPQNDSYGESENQVASGNDENEHAIETVMEVVEADQRQREIKGTGQDEMTEAEAQDTAATDGEPQLLPPMISQ